MAVWMYFGNADFGTVIGTDFEHMKTFIHHIKVELMANLHGSVDSDFWNFEAKPGNYICITLKCRSSLKKQSR